MKTNNSAPLTPLAPPAGITGTTLAFAVDSLTNPPYTTGEHKGLSVVDFDAPASPVDSVGVPEFSLSEDNQSDTVTLLDGDGLRVAQFGSVDFTFDESKRHAQKIVASLASHAAKDAKIRALEEAADFETLEAISSELREGHHSARAHSLLVIAGKLRAALALPCAPLGS